MICSRPLALVSPRKPLVPGRVQMQGRPWDDQQVHGYSLTRFQPRGGSRSRRTFFYVVIAYLAIFVLVCRTAHFGGVLSPVSFDSCESDPHWDRLFLFKQDLGRWPNQDWMAYRQTPFQPCRAGWAGSTRLFRCPARARAVWNCRYISPDRAGGRRVKPALLGAQVKLVPVIGLGRAPLDNMQGA